MNKLDLAKKKRVHATGTQTIETVLKIDERLLEDLVKELRDSVDELVDKDVEIVDIDIEPLVEGLKDLQESLNIKESFDLLNQNLDNLKTDKKFMDELSNKIESLQTLLTTKEKVVTDPYDEYKASISDESRDGEKYFGFIAKTGKWFILREQGEKSKTWKYASGKDGFSKGWAVRSNLDYVFYDEVAL